MTDYATQRRNMVDGQIKPNRVVSHKLLEALDEVPRELFVPSSSRGYAYVDTDLRLSDTRAMLKPMVLARLLQEAHVRPTDIALVVDGGTGYSAAVLAHLAETVILVESDGELAHTATSVLAQLQVDNVVVLNKPARQGHKEQAPYDVIVIDGLVDEVPAEILDQLAEDGRLLAIVAGDGPVGEARLYIRIGGVIGSRPLFEASGQRLPEFAVAPSFTF